jgi:hypothetical protein
MVAEKTAGEKILLEMRDSALLHCDERGEKHEAEGTPIDHGSVTWLRLAGIGLPLCASRTGGLWRRGLTAWRWLRRQRTDFFGLRSSNFLALRLRVFAINPPFRRRGQGHLPGPHSSPSGGELPIRVVFSCDDQRVFVTDFAGRVTVWTVKDGKRAGELNANPVPHLVAGATVP